MTLSKPLSLSFLVSFALMSALVGCATTEQTGSGGTTTTQSGNCAPGQTIKRYCATQGGPEKRCLSYDEDVASVRRQLVAAKGGLFRYTLGTCGALRFVRTQTMGLGTDYYDASGNIVATEAHGELPICGDTPYKIGVVPACKEQVVEEKSTIDEPSTGP